MTSERVELRSRSIALAAQVRTQLAGYGGAPVASDGVNELIQHAIESALEHELGRGWATTGNTLVTASPRRVGDEVWLDVYVAEIMKHARIVLPKFAVGDRVQPTAQARVFLAADAIKTPSVVCAVNGAAVQLDPPAPDFTPAGVPAAWLEKVPL